MSCNWQSPLASCCSAVLAVSRTRTHGPRDLGRHAWFFATKCWLDPGARSTEPTRLQHALHPGIHFALFRMKAEQRRVLNVSNGQLLCELVPKERWPLRRKIIVAEYYSARLDHGKSLGRLGAQAWLLIAGIAEHDFGRGTVGRGV